jgi:hypothetical protein
MESGRLVQAVVLAVILVVGGYLIFTLMDGWATWVVFGFLLLGTWGGALAVDDTRYSRRGRTFVKHWDKPR